MGEVHPLAIFGAPPAFAQPLHVGRPNIGDRERLFARIEDMLDRRWLTNRGPFVQEFERTVAHYLGVRNCVAMCNATVALEIAIRAAGLHGEVIVPAMTFIATAHALQWQQITPVFADVDPATHNLDPESVEAAITPNTTGIIGVHVWGNPCAVDALTEIARRHQLTLMFDAAHAFGCAHRGRMIGGFGRAEVLSFHATKFFNTLEGGAVVTDDDEFARRVRLMQNFGFEDYDTVTSIGTNGKMNEVSAAMGLTSFESLDDFVQANLRNYRQYLRELDGLPGVSQLRYPETGRHNYQYIVLEIDAAAAGISRDELVRVLWAEQVMARRYFFPGCHRMEPYRSRPAAHQVPLPHTEALVQRTLLLPTGSAVSPAEVSEVCRILRQAIGNSGAVRARLRDMELEAVR